MGGSLMKPKKTYTKTKLVIGAAGGGIAFVAGLAALPAVAVGVGTWLTVRWLDK